MVAMHKIKAIDEAEIEKTKANDALLLKYQKELKELTYGLLIVGVVAAVYYFLEIAKWFAKLVCGCH